MKTTPIVTEQYMLETIKLNPSKVIGRALLAIYNRQTSSEQSCGETRMVNGVGFTAFDANLGTRCAEYFKTHDSLQEWMIQVWLKPTGKKQRAKILKYTNQLNEIAKADAKRRKHYAHPKPGT